MLDIQDDISSYLAFSHYIDWNEPSVQRKAKELKDSTEGEIELAKASYYFVRDEIKHSWDVQDKRVTATASDALREGVGICWAKSNLLAALLRANGIPAGICYQRLTLGSTPESGYCIHALNAIYLRSIDRWIRVDARGNDSPATTAHHAKLDKSDVGDPCCGKHLDRDGDGIGCSQASRPG